MNNKVNNISSDSFILLLEKGESIAYETLFRLYYDKLVHISIGYLGCYDDAEEIVQNLFLKLWEDKKKLKPISNINSYLYTMVKYACLDFIKHEKIKMNFVNSSLEKKLSIQHQFIKDEAASLLLENELENKILEGIDLLPEKCRKVFLKSRFEGLKHHEIAKLLDVSKRTVDNHISNALKHMRLHLKEFLTLFL
ncbi:MAG: RNA polymerase sigma-70 factor [Cellulophaga sp.]